MNAEAGGGCFGRTRNVQMLAENSPWVALSCGRSFPRKRESSGGGLHRRDGTQNFQTASKVQFRLVFLACALEVCCCYLVSFGRSSAPDRGAVGRRLARFSLLCARGVSRPAPRRTPRTTASDPRSRPRLPPDAVVEPGDALGRHFPLRLGWPRPASRHQPVPVRALGPASGAPARRTLPQRQPP